MAELPVLPGGEAEVRRLREALAEAGQKIGGIERQLLVAETRARAAEQASTGLKTEIEQLRATLAAAGRRERALLDTLALGGTYTATCPACRHEVVPVDRSPGGAWSCPGCRSRFGPREAEVIWSEPPRRSQFRRDLPLADFTIDPPGLFDAVDAEPGKQDPAEVAEEFRALFPKEEDTDGRRA